MPEQDMHKVVSIVSDPLKPERVRVRVGDDVYVLDISHIVELQLSVGKRLTPNDLDALQSEASLVAAKERALRLLSYRAYTENELADRLKRYDYEAECIGRVISWLKELGYLDDRAFAQRWVEQRTQSKGLGPIRLRHELMRKGVASDIIAHAVTGVSDDEYERVAYHLARQRILREGETLTQKTRARLYGFLQRRGFSGPMIHRVMRRLYDEFPAVSTHE